MLLEVSEIRKSFVQGDRTVEVLCGVSFVIERGEFVALMGPSGSGKSTLLALIGALDRPSSGSIRFRGEAIESLSDKEISKFRRRNLGFVFQLYNLIPTLTAIENVALPLLLDGGSTADAAAKAERLIGKLGLMDRAHCFVSEFSGGEMQRLAIARALLTEPALILADEPTGSLDSKSGESVLQTLRDAATQGGQTVLLVTHDPGAAAYADRVIQLHDGKIVPAPPTPRVGRRPTGAPPSARTTA